MIGTCRTKEQKKQRPRDYRKAVWQFYLRRWLRRSELGLRGRSTFYEIVPPALLFAYQEITILPLPSGASP
jgi:hypothetical protein